jgi:hypothetical protein
VTGSENATGTDASDPVDGPGRVTNARLFTVATAFTVAVVGLGFLGAFLPGFSRAAGLAVLGCIALYGAFGLVLVYRAGQRL